jgi:hypothetical protein
MPEGRAASSAPHRIEGSARALIGVCLFVFVASALLVLSFDHGRDQSIYALVAREMLRGGMPYRDAFDFKPPGIFILYAGVRAVFGARMIGIRVVEVIAMCIELACILRLCRAFQIDARVGWIAAALSAQVHAQLDFWHTAQPETFGATLTLLGFVAWTRARQTSSSTTAKVTSWIVVGLCFGFAGLMKPPLAGGGAVLAMITAITEFRERRSRSAAIPIIGTAIGGILPIALTLAYFAARGALGDLREVLLVFTPHYTKISWENQSVFNMTYYGFVEWLTTYSSALLVGYVCLVALGVRDNEKPLVFAVILVIATHILGVVMQAKFFPYHWGATFPISAILAALGLFKVGERLASRSAIIKATALGAFVLLAMLKAPVPSFGPVFLERAAMRAEITLYRSNAKFPNEIAAWDSLASVADVDAGQNRAVAERVNAITSPDAPLFVWGFECAIYDLAERPIASRYIYNVPQRATWSAEPMQRALMDELRNTPPAAIVVEHNDVFRMVTGNNDDSARSLLSFSELRDFLESEYTLDTTIGDFDIYVSDGARTDR